MHRLSSTIILGIFSLTLAAQTTNSTHTYNGRPRLVVGIVIDQMRWDFLYRYYERYGNDGFKKIMNRGFNCENNFIPYSPTVTAPGHATVYTGTVPGIHGITGNAWWDRNLRRDVYCTEDKSVTTVGSNSTLGVQSPRNLLVTTICDEMRLATNFRSKTVGVAIKDRGSILPAGHSGQAYWYDNSNGNFISSSFYFKELPSWANDFNRKKMVDKYYEQGWTLSFPANTYTQSTSDDKPYELKGIGAGFPYNFRQHIGKNYGVIASTPYGNTLTLEMSKAAIEGEQLGNDEFTDFLAISLSSPDYIGHSFGPNSMEQEDNFIKLDRDLADFLNYLDRRIGANQYLLFISADHGAAHVPGFMKENNFPAGNFEGMMLDDQMNQLLREKYGHSGLIASSYNYQITINDSVLAASKADKEELIEWIIDHLKKQPAIDRAFAISEVHEEPLHKHVREMIANGYHPARSGDVQYMLKAHYIEGFLPGGTTHGSWNPYDSHIPLLFYGWGIKPGRLTRETYMTDIAPTLAALLRIQMPSGSVGKVITEILE